MLNICTLCPTFKTVLVGQCHVTINIVHMDLVHNFPLILHLTMNDPKQTLKEGIINTNI